MTQKSNIKSFLWPLHGLRTLLLLVGFLVYPGYENFCLVLMDLILSHLVVVSCSLLKENVGGVILEEMGEGLWGVTGGKTVIRLCCTRGESICNKKQVHNLRPCVKYRGWKWMHFGNRIIKLIPNTHSQ